VIFDQSFASAPLDVISIGGFLGRINGYQKPRPSNSELLCAQAGSKTAAKLLSSVPIFSREMLTTPIELESLKFKVKDLKQNNQGKQVET
jgi:hypothetical protein